MINVRCQKKKRKRRFQKDSDGQLQQTEKKAFANWCASDKCGNSEVLRRSRSSFTAPKLAIGYAASQRFCFAPLISLNNLNDLNLKIIEAQSLNGLPGKPESNFHVEFETKIY